MSKETYTTHCNKPSNNDRFLQTFNERWRQNENVMLLLSAIVLFRPDRPNVRDFQTVSRNQQQYYSLLKRLIKIIIKTPETSPPH